MRSFPFKKTYLVLRQALAVVLIFSFLLSPYSFLPAPFVAHAANIQVRQEINITDAYYFAVSGSYATTSEIVNLDPSKYTGATYYFEVVASTTAGTNATVSLVNSTSSASVASVTVNGGNTYQLYRSSSFTAPSMATDYTVVLGKENIGKGILAARIVVLQNAATITNTETQIEIGNNETYTSTATSTFASPKYWHYDARKWDGSPSFSVEVTYMNIAGVASSTAYTTAGTENVVIPSGTASTTIELTAGGGSGGAASNTNRPNGGSGGAGGQYAKSVLGGLAGTHTLVIAASRAGNSNADGTVGNDSTWDTTSVVAKGGAPGIFGTVASATVASTTGNTTGCVGNISCFAGGGGGAGVGATYGGGGGAGAGTLGTGNSATGAGIAGATTTNAGGSGGAKSTVTNVAGTQGNGIAGVAYGGGGGGGAWHSATNSAGTPAGGAGAHGLATTTDWIATTTIALQVSDGTGDGFVNWTTAATIIGNNPVATSTRVRVSFTPVDGRNYRLAFATKDSRDIFAIYNAKIVVDQTSPTLFETQYLLANTKLAGGNALQNFLTSWTTAEWVGVVNTYKHVVDAANNSASVVEVDTAGGSQVTNSVVTSPDNQGTSTSMTMPANGNIDVKATTNGGDIFASRVDVAAVIMTVSGAPTALSAKNTGVQVALTWSAPSSNGNSAITNYKIYRDTHTVPTTLLATIGNVLTYNDTAIQPGAGITYYYRVVATNAIGDSGFSNEVNTLPNRTYISKPPNYLSSGNGLLAYWTFDGKNMLQNVADISGNSNNGHLCTSATSTVPGKIGQALSFNGTNQCVDVANIADNLSNFTVSAWFKTTASLSGNGKQVVSKMGSGGIGAGIGWQLNVTGSARTIPANRIDFEIQNGSGAQWVGRYATAAINDGRWHHALAVVQNSNTAGATVTLYIDGDSSPTATDNGGTWNTNGISNALHLLIADDNDNEYFSGSIDDVRVYTRALAAAEAAQLYRAGSAKVNKETVTAGVATGNGLVGYWTFDGKNMLQNVADSSGQGNTGFLKGGATSTKPGRIGQALSFNGTTSHVDIADNDTLTPGTGVTWSFWIYPNVSPPAIENGILEKLVGGDVNTDEWNIALDVSGNPHVSWQTTSSDTTYGTTHYNDMAFTGYTFTAKRWVHITIVRNATDLLLYVNGVLTQTLSGAMDSSPYKNSTADVHIGDQVNNSRFFNGYLDDVRMYNRVLSATEVNQLYNFGKAKAKP